MIQPAQIAAPSVVQDVPAAAVPLEQLHVLGVHEAPLKWKPTLQPAQILALVVVQDASVAAVPPEQLHVLVAQDVLLRW